MQQIVLAKWIFIGGVFCVEPRLMALVIRAAADWQALGGWVGFLRGASREGRPVRSALGPD
jgi:hypothetical protein